MTTANKYLTASPVRTSPSIALTAARMAATTASLVLILVALLHFIKSDLSPAGHMLSEYARPPHGWIMQCAFLAWSLSCLALSWSIRSQVTTTAGRVGLGLLYVTGIALLLGGLCVIDDPFTPPAEPTLQGSLHGLAAMIGLPGQAIAALLISYSLKKNQQWRTAGTPLVRFAHAIWISLLLMFAATFAMFAQSGGQFIETSYLGWTNRLLLLTNCAWLIAVARNAIAIGSNR